MQLPVVTRDDLGHPGTSQLLRWLFGRLHRYRVIGASMEPTLFAEEFVLVSSRVEPAPNELVVARHPSDPDLVLIKRLARIEDGEYVLASDNERAGTDSRRFGSVERSSIIGVVVARFPAR